MRIQHNIMAMNSYRNLSGNNGALSKNLEKLSSGYRINRAGDDAAGLAISEKMRAQISGLDQAQKNAQSGINLVKTAEGALTEVHDMLNRMVTLATQSANGTYEASDREKLQAEVDALIEEIDRIAENSNFNGTKLLDGSLGAGEIEMDATNSTLKAGTAIESGKSIVASVTGELEKGTYTLATGSFDADGVWTAGTGAGDTTVQVAFEPDDGSGAKEVTYVDLSDLAQKFTDNTDMAKAGYSSTINLGKFSVEIVNTADGNTAAKYIAGLNGKTVVGVDSGTPVNSEGLQLQIGASSNETIAVNIDSMSASSLGISALSIKNVDDANGAIDKINDAIEKVSVQRGDLGAIQNRLEHTINNLGVMEENIQDAESNIRDTDIAEEMMAYTKNNILIQSAQAMLAQANQVPQGVLQLMQ